jgi:hypothetical protein
MIGLMEPPFITRTNDLHHSNEGKTGRPDA